MGNQGWWPDGLLTPPSDAAMRSDIEFLKASGFKTLRKHIKVEAAPVKPAMSRAELEAGLKSHDRALYVKQGWIRDPYITLGPDDYFYLTGTTPNPKDPAYATPGPDEVQKFAN